MERQRVDQLMIGLPGTGKTTFLAALWHVLHSDEVPGALKLESVEGDREYLNRIADAWRGCEEIGRTPVGVEAVSFKVINPDSSESTRLFVPDMSGETFASQWESREASAEYLELAARASGILFFLHPDATDETDSLVRLNRLVGTWTDGDTSSSTSPTPEPWNAAAAPTQVKAVELLQFLQELHPDPLRIAVVVSAWDKAAPAATAEAWVAKRLPLLDQFLRANRASFATQMYGVSAQGGSLEQQANELLDEDVSSRRIKIVGPEVLPHDITAPVKWLMGV